MYWLIYITIGLVLWVVFSIALAAAMAYGENDPEPEDWIMGAIFGLAMALFWPLSLIVWGVARFARNLYENAKVKDRV